MLLIFLSWFCSHATVRLQKPLLWYVWSWWWVCRGTELKVTSNCENYLIWKNHRGCVSTADGTRDTGWHGTWDMGHGTWDRPRILLLSVSLWLWLVSFTEIMLLLLMMTWHFSSPSSKCCCGMAVAGVPPGVANVRVSWSWTALL